MFEISFVLNSGCSALRSTMNLLTAGGSTRRFADSESNRLSKPSLSKRSTLRYNARCKEPVANASSGLGLRKAPEVGSARSAPARATRKAA
jgi:hypothetical protein